MRQLMVAYQIITMNNNCSACAITISSAGNKLESRKNSFFPVPFQDELACGVGSGSCIHANARLEANKWFTQKRPLNLSRSYKNVNDFSDSAQEDITRLLLQEAFGRHQRVDNSSKFHESRLTVSEKLSSGFPEHIKMQSALILNEFKSDPRRRAFHLFPAAQPSKWAKRLLLLSFYYAHDIVNKFVLHSHQLFAKSSSSFRFSSAFRRLSSLPFKDKQERAMCVMFSGLEVGRACRRGWDERKDKQSKLNAFLPFSVPGVAAAAASSPIEY